MEGKVILEGKIKTGKILIGFGQVGIFDQSRSRTIWKVHGDVVFKGSADIGHGSKISVEKNASLIMGDHFTISAESAIVSAKKIVFGNDCLLSWNILLMDSDWHEIKDCTQKVINPSKEIIIGDKVWIGCRSTILKGATIPSGSIIAASSLVTKKLITECAIYAGNSATPIKTNISW